MAQPSRKTLNVVVDTAALVGFVALIATGLMLRYTLPPGSGGRMPLGGGRGRGAAREVALVLGLTRHEWGDVHFWISVGLLGVLALHVGLHWRWVVSVVRGGARPAGSGGVAARVVVGIVALTGLLLLVLLPLFLEVERVPRSALREPAEVAEPP